MTSQIDPTVPVAGTPTTASVRANFLVAQAEITALQNVTADAPFLPLAGGTLTGALYLAGDPTDPRMPATKAYVDAGSGGGGGGIPEAPADGTLYGRRNGAWLQAAAPGDITTAIAAIPAATEGARGTIQIATTAQVTTGTDDAAAVTALKLTQRLGAAVANYLPLIGGTLTGNLTLAPTAAGASPTIAIRKPDTTGAAIIQGLTGANLMWSIALGAATNNNFVIHRQTGAAAGDALTIEQAAPFTNFAGLASIGPQGTNSPLMPMLCGPIAQPPTGQDGLTIAARRLNNPASSGAYFDGAVILLRGPFAPNAGGVEIIVGTQAAGYQVSTFNSAGDLTLARNLGIGGDLAVGNSLTVNNQLVVTGAFTVQNNAQINGNLGVGNGITLSGNVDANVNNGQWLGGSNGNAWYVVSSYNFNTVSDARVKTNIRPLPHGLDEVLRLEPVAYEAADGTTQVGLIAQQVREVIPEIVWAPREEDGYLGLAYGPLAAVLAKAIQQLAARLDALEARL
jgi:hypothetical protein